MTRKKHPHTSSMKKGEHLSLGPKLNMLLTHYLECQCSKNCRAFVKNRAFSALKFLTTFKSHVCKCSWHINFTNYQGPPLYQAALSLIQSSSPFPTRTRYFPLYPNFCCMKHWMSFLALKVVILKPPGWNLSDENCCELPQAAPATQATHLNHAEGLHLSALSSFLLLYSICEILVSLKQDVGTLDAEN